MMPVLSRRGRSRRPVAAGGGGGPIAGYTLWLDANAITGLSDGDPVTTWADQSGNGNDVTGSGASRPTYKTGILNGLPVVRFDGGDSLSSSMANSSPYTVAIVGKMQSGGNQYFFDGASVNTGLISNAGTDSLFFLYSAPSGFVLGATTTIWNTLIGVFNGASSALTVSGVTTTGETSTSGTTGLIVGNSMGGTPLNGDIAEFLIYPFALDATQRADLETYFQGKYAL